MKNNNFDFEELEEDDNCDLGLDDDDNFALPTNLEEAKEFIAADNESMNTILTTSSIEVLVDMLADAGLIDKETYRQAVLKEVDATVTSIAERYINHLEAEVFEYEKD